MWIIVWLAAILALFLIDWRAGVLLLVGFLVFASGLFRRIAKYERIPDAGKAILDHGEYEYNSGRLSEGRYRLIEGLLHAGKIKEADEILQMHVERSKDSE